MKKKYTTEINTNICSGYMDKHIQNPFTRKKVIAILLQCENCYHAVSKCTVSMRVKLDPNVGKKGPDVEKKGLNVEKKEKRNSQHR